MRNFFGSLPDSDSVSILYPKVMFDPYNKHFIVVMEAIRSVDKKSWYFMAVSKTSSPQGAWAFWELNMSLNGGAKSGFFADYPGVGFDQASIYLTGNMANWESRFQYAKIRVLKKSEVYKFGKVNWHDFFKLADATGAKAVSIQPSQSIGTAPSGYLISSGARGASKLTLWNVANNNLTRKEVIVTGYLPPPDAPQKGGPSKVGTGDASLGNAVFRNGIIYTAHTIAGSGGSVIRYYEVRTDGSVAQQATFSPSGKYEYFPVVAVDSRGNSVVAFNQSSGGQFVSMAFTGRKPSDPKNTLQPSAPLKAGASYYHFSARQTQLWGAYNGIALDYDDSIWIAGAYARAKDQWDTIVGKVSY